MLCLVQNKNLRAPFWRSQITVTASSVHSRWIFNFLMQFSRVMWTENNLCMRFQSEYAFFKFLRRNVHRH